MALRPCDFTYLLALSDAIQGALSLFNKEDIPLDVLLSVECIKRFCQSGADIDFD